ncbi:MAG: hypothetical protein WCV90_06030 [Candidatus Woesearchaeota archaeon]|jgi:hypothetical protein
MKWIRQEDGCLHYSIDGKDLSDEVQMNYEMAECYSGSRRVPWFGKWKDIPETWHFQSLDEVKGILAARYGSNNPPITAPLGYDSFYQLERIRLRRDETTYSFQIIPGSGGSSDGHPQFVHCRIKYSLRSVFDLYWTEKELTGRVNAP